MVIYIYDGHTVAMFIPRFILSQASEGKALLLPEEMEIIRARLLAAGRRDVVTGDSENVDSKETNVDPITVPEELFRKYTETDSRPLTPAPTLVSVQAVTMSSRPVQNDSPAIIYNPRERTTLVLDLRAKSQPQLVR